MKILPGQMWKYARNANDTEYSNVVLSDYDIREINRCNIKFIRPVFEWIENEYSTVNVNDAKTLKNLEFQTNISLIESLELDKS